MIRRPVISGSSQSRLVLELAPSNIQNHCETPMTYVGFMIGGNNVYRNTWNLKMVPQILIDDSSSDAMVQASIPQVLENRSSWGFGFEVNLTYEILPWQSVVGPLIEYVESISDARRVEYSGDFYTNLQFENCRDYSIFPRIMYSFYNVTEPTVHNQRDLDRQVDFILYPEDFVDIVTGSDGTSYCNVHIRSAGNHVDFGTIGSNLIRAINIHLDSAKRLIGFCDPL
jgi:hypothetical protein